MEGIQAENKELKMILESYQKKFSLEKKVDKSSQAFIEFEVHQTVSC